MIKEHSLNFKALDGPWTASFKRYFLVHFVENLVIFTTVLLVQEETVLILRQLFAFSSQRVRKSGQFRPIRRIATTVFKQRRL